MEIKEALRQVTKQTRANSQFPLQSAVWPPVFVISLRCAGTYMWKTALLFNFLRLHVKLTGEACKKNDFHMSYFYAIQFFV